jgi:ATP-binding cassette subfamily B (MDR/TAP) protein 1
MKQDKSEMENEEEELAQSKFSHSKVMEEMSVHNENQPKGSEEVSIRNSQAGSRKNSQAMDDELAKKIKEEKKDEKTKKKKKLLHIITSGDYLTGSDKCMVFLGVIASGLVGVVMPFLGYYFGKVLAVYGQYDFINKIPANDVGDIRETLWDKGMEFFYVMLGIALGSFLFAFFQFFFFGKVSIKFVLKVRAILFRKFIYKDIKYFDQPENKPGNLSAKLSNDCNLIRTLVSSYLGSILQSLASFLLGLGFGFYFSWRITLLVIGLSPLLVLSGIMESIMFFGSSSAKLKEDENIVQETFNNIKMVKSLVSENSIHEKYMSSIKIGNKKTFKKNLCLSIMLGVSQFGQFIVFAIIFYAAGVWREKYGLDMMKLFTAIFSLIFGVYGAGMANQFIGDVGKAQAAAANIFTHINELPDLEYDKNDPLYAKASQMKTRNKDLQGFINKINENCKEKTSRSKPELTGNIEFKNVWFKFPTRNTYTLRGFNMSFKAGQNCAIVGASGSGKSTIFQLLMRFYNADKGQILIDGHDIQTIDLQHLRSFFGLIKQEPEIFNGNIGYNIVYNTEGKTEDEIQNACDTSNSQEFIDLHNEGRERSAGNRGDALSGGQKQRLTIARVLLKNPKVYLFDEATSALDSHSEKVVQNAIEKIWDSHSSLTIAHRFSTIKNCDKIFVLQKGKVTEKGTYDELMMRKGVFYGLAVD